MKLIVGLGNPGNEYNFTRHNFGFLALDFYAKIKGFTWEKPKLHAIWAKQGDILFIKPQNFYNDSGLAVQEFLNYYKIPLENLLVVCDDFSLPFGTLRYRAKGSAAGNNGLKSISGALHTTDFPRLRLGTENNLRAKIGDVDFVLGKFTPEEKEQLPAILRDFCQKLDELLI